ncbi:hypothetical protein [Polaribacter sp.]|uniref:hypothetical protein n=1 Tax=Polaribacter sp. TaxID=1920175 RepID=UPI002F353850
MKIINLSEKVYFNDDNRNIDKNFNKVLYFFKINNVSTIEIVSIISVKRNISVFLYVL